MGIFRPIKLKKNDIIAANSSVEGQPMTQVNIKQASLPFELVAGEKVHYESVITNETETKANSEY